MKYLLPGLIITLFSLGIFSCRKTSFNSSPNALVGLSADTLSFDTVFTSIGSVTQSFKIFNLNDQKLRLSNVKLMGGSSSAFKMNVDGTPGVSFSDIELEPNDSIYVFVSITAGPNSADRPFLIMDSILINYNGNNEFVQLEAFGQNAHFLRNRRVTTDSTWKNDLPYVVLGGLSVDSNVTLTIEKGSKIYLHADAPLIVNGTLKVSGEADARVIFDGDRLDPGYNGLPSGWPGIYFSSSGSGSILNYAVIRNAFKGIVTQANSTSGSPVILNQCIIYNVANEGILSMSGSIKAVNCLIANCGNNILITGGGTYSFDHCTVAGIGNILVEHKSPVLSISNADSLGNIFNLNASFRNCIFYGEGGSTENEVIVDKKGSPSPAAFNVAFQNVLYKDADDQPNIMAINSFRNDAPEFDSINAEKIYFDFHLKPVSPAVNAGVKIGVNIDLDGNARSAATGLPDLGCYEQ